MQSISNMAEDKLPEVWMRGPLPGIAPLLQPVAHALMQAKEEVEALMKDFPERLLWEKVAGMASPAFHLQHMAGVLNRLLTYAKGEALSEEQLGYLASEGKYNGEITLSSLLEAFGNQVDLAIAALKTTGESVLTEIRGVGRKQLPSTVIGLLVHAAEHTMRHAGQLLVTVRVLKAEINL